MLTVSLELAKKMRKLGWGKNTHFFETTLDEILETSGTYKEQSVVFLPTAQEILDELPALIGLSELTMTVCDDKSGYMVKYTSLGHSFQCEEYLAEALGQLRCWCKENGYLDTKKTDE